MEDKSSPKYAVVGVVGVPANYGGFETLVENLVSDSDISPKNRIEKDFLVFCSGKAYSEKNIHIKMQNLFIFRLMLMEYTVSFMIYYV